MREISRNKADMVRALYSRRAAIYAWLVNLLGYQGGLKRVFSTSMASSLKPRAKVLDAGCGTGIVTFALLAAYARKQIRPARVDGFDLTPAMLRRFEVNLSRKAVTGVRLHQADLFKLEALPEDWTSYDLIVTSAMLEYLPKLRLPEGLQSLRSRLKPGGRLLLFISRKSAFNRWAMERWWRASCYDPGEIASALELAGFSKIVFHAFPPPFRFLNSWGLAIEAQ